VIRCSPVHDEHIRAGARLTEFGGWLMPLQYEGVVAEHWAVRRAAGLFDVSHLGKLVVHGDDAIAFLDSVLPGSVGALEEWTAGYNLVLSEEGGILDDIFVYRRPDSLVVVPNAANTETVLGVLEAAAEGVPGVDIEDARGRWAIFAVQGPRTREMEAWFPPAAAQLPLHAFGDLEVAGVSCQVARTGYTGEHGFELFVGWDDAATVWNALLEGGAAYGLVPAGLGARDTLRLEMGYPLHGQDISPETNPIEARLNWVIDWSKSAFTAREVLSRIRESGPSRRLVGLVARGRGIPRHGHAVLSEGGVVGEVTSGNISPVLAIGIGMAYVPPSLAAPGTTVTVDVRGRALEAEVAKPPFIRSWQRERDGAV
jgi:glycine cleavage system T protein (aminomethyltransferase)